ncbi:MAG TPA: ABC transporter ATP-binding protein [Tetragenococcus sp.]|nr:ABC transporter ATP-binding protein [Tetragenococcus sp.]
MNYMIEIKNLSKQYKEQLAVNHINFKVKKGELFAFLGTNGAGKSTTINMICTLLAKTTGNIRVDGFDLDKHPFDVRKRLGIVFQENVLDDLLTVEDNLRIRAQFGGLYGKKLNDRLLEIKMRLDLTEIWQNFYGRLSGGQKRKCEIARALLNSPKLLILDEPTTGLDPQTRKTIWKLIQELQLKNGVTVFLTTHYMEEAAKADHVVILEKGKICAEGTPDILKSKYGKDLLRIQFRNMEKGKRQLANLEIKAETRIDYFQIAVSDSHQALKILNSLTEFLAFELINGNMDDVFLAVTGHKGVPK